MLVDEQHIVLEAGVEVRLESEVDDNRVVVAVNVRVDAVQPLEYLEDQGLEGLREGHADPRGKHGFVVDIGLHPGHEVFDVFRRRHLCRLFVFFAVLPKVLKSSRCELRDRHIRALANLTRP